MSDEIQVPYNGFQVGRPFPRFETWGKEKALRDCEAANHEALFMPRVVDARIAASDGAYILKNIITPPSVRLTGRGKISSVSKPGGTPVVVYAHLPTSLSDPDYLAKVREDHGRMMKNYAAVFPNKEFQDLLDKKDDKTIFVVDADVLRRSSSNVIALSKALKHPQTIPFLGGKDRAEKYLQKHERVYGNSIGIWHSNDLDDNGLVLGRWLFLGLAHNNALNGDLNINSNGLVVGVPHSGHAPQARQDEKADRSLEEQLLALAENHVSRDGRGNYQQAVKDILSRR